MPAHEQELALLLDVTRSAGEIALDHAAGPLEVTDKPDGAGPVTQADLAVNAHLESHLRTARPEFGWLSEESAEDPTRRGAKDVFVVDPIDGTRSFIDGSRTWAISVAIVRDGKPVAGVVHMPAREMTFAAIQGGGATLNGGRLDKPGHRPALDGADILATRPSFEAQHWKGPVPSVRRAHRPSLAYRLCLVAQGRFDGMFTFRPSWEWDIVAGALICGEAGLAVSDGFGQPLRFNNTHPQTPGIIAAGNAVWADIVGRRPPPRT